MAQNITTNSVAPGAGQVPHAPQGDTSTFLEKVANALYKLPGVNSAADSVINVGNEVAKQRDTIVKGASNIVTNTVSQVNFISKYGLYIVILGAIVYFLAISGGLAALTRSRR